MICPAKTVLTPHVDAKGAPILPLPLASSSTPRDTLHAATHTRYSRLPSLMGPKTTEKSIHFTLSFSATGDLLNPLK